MSDCSSERAVNKNPYDHYTFEMNMLTIRYSCNNINKYFCEKPASPPWKTAGRKCCLASRNCWFMVAGERSPVMGSNPCESTSLVGGASKSCASHSWYLRLSLIMQECTSGCSGDRRNMRRTLCSINSGLSVNILSFKHYNFPIKNLSAGIFFHSRTQFL